MAARLVAFDTATEQMAVALHDGAQDGLIDEAGGAAASARLVPAIEELLARAGLAWRDIEGIAYGQGPGAFTGLRTSCSVAQGLAFALDRPLLALDSLLLVAEDLRERIGANEIAVAMDARMDEVYAARYRFSDGGWQVLDAPALYTLPALQARWGRVTIEHLVGTAVTAFAERLGLKPRQAHASGGSRAAAALRLAQQLWPTGPRLAARDALPLYLRDKVALTTREREALAAR